jgi:hypothetical protein
MSSPNGDTFSIWEVDVQIHTGLPTYSVMTLHSMTCSDGHGLYRVRSFYKRMRHI